MESKQVLILVDELQESGGFIHKLNTFKNTLHRINNEYYDSFTSELESSVAPQLVKCERLGRYIVLIEMKKNWTSGTMLFFDFKKNDQLAFKIFDSIYKSYEDEDKSLAKNFVALYHLHKNRYYDADYDLVRLEKDTSELN